MSFEMKSFASALMVLSILTNRAEATHVSLSSGGADTALSKVCSRKDPAMDPFYEVRYGQDVVWQIPHNPKAVLFLAHGANKDPLSYFDRAPHCGKCYGLPETRRAVLSALQRNYAVISVQSSDVVYLPWNLEVWPPPPSEDRTNVVAIIKEWTKEHSLDHLPLAAFGFSMGGNFSTVLTYDLDFKSMIIMCTPGDRMALLNANASFPPTLFLAMPVDKDGFYPQAAISRNILKSKGVRTAQIDMLPRPIRPSNFTEKIPCLEQDTAERIYGAFKAENWLNAEDYLIKVPSDFEAVLWKHKVLPFCEKTHDICLSKHVGQELNVAYAFHSFSSQFNREIFDWLDDTVFLGSSEPARSWASQ